MNRWRWAAHEHHVSLGSTNTEALADPRPGRVVVADHQSAGQGRLGRSWSSPAGTGMAISAVVPALSPSVVGWLPLVAGLAVVRALAESRWPVEAALKWPNDVLVPLREAGRQGEDAAAQEPVLTDAGRGWGKIAGILAQVAPAGTVVVGTGLNVDHTPDQLPVPTATSWRVARGGAPLPEGARQAFLESYLDHLARLHDDLAQGRVAAARTAYLDRCLTVGAEVTLHLPDGTTCAGRAVTVDDDGALVLDGPGGRTTHHAGDVRHARAR